MWSKITIIFFNTSWKFMQVGMFLYMTFFSKYVNKIFILFNKIKKYTSNNKPYIFVLNNSILDNNLSINIENQDYDYLIYKEYYNNIHNNNENENKNENEKTLMFLTDNIKNKKINLEPCNFEFIMVVIKSNNQSYNISKILKNNSHYYYVNGGKLFTKNFINWIALYHLKITLDNPEILIMDKSIKEIKLNSSQFILLHKDKYEIIDI